jgi:orotidine-5'-phosphate decarboxylase
MSAITTQTYAQRSAKHVNPTAKRLLAIMERKQSNLCVSVDVTTAQEALEVVRRVGKSVCMVKVRL